MFKIKFRYSALTFENSTVLFNYKLENIRNKQVVLDFSNLTFINPFGMLFLKYLLDTLSDNNRVEVILGNPDIINYLVRMSFNQHYISQNNIKFQPDINSILLRKSDLSDRLIELTNYDIKNDDDVENITYRITGILASKIPYYNEISDILYTALSETLSNIQVHSTSQVATVCLQTYGNSIIIALGDNGIGIKAGLKSEGKHLNHEDAIEKALEPFVSGRPDGGGMGLTELVENIKIRNDCMGIRSGNGYIYLENNVIRKGKCARLPGTQIMIKLSKC